VVCLGDKDVRGQWGWSIFMPSGRGGVDIVKAFSRAAVHTTNPLKIPQSMSLSTEYLPVYSQKDSLLHALTRQKRSPNSSALPLSRPYIFDEGEGTGI